MFTIEAVSVVRPFKGPGSKLDRRCIFDLVSVLNLIEALTQPVGSDQYGEVVSGRLR
jgi:hypothetical protein